MMFLGQKLRIYSDWTSEFGFKETDMILDHAPVSCCVLLTRLLLSRVTTAPSTSLPPLTLSVSLWLANQRSVLRHDDQSQVSIEAR